MNQPTPLPTALLPTSRKEREKWGTAFVFSAIASNSSKMWVARLTQSDLWGLRPQSKEQLSQR